MTEAKDDYESAAKVIEGYFPPHSRAMAPLKGGGGGGNFSDMDAWQTSVETRLGGLQSDVRQVLYVSIAGIVLMLGAFGGGYLALTGKMDTQYERLSSKIDTLSDSVATLKADVAVIKATNAK